MDGLFHGKPYEQKDDLGGTMIFGNTRIFVHNILRSWTCEWILLDW